MGSNVVLRLVPTDDQIEKIDRLLSVNTLLWNMLSSTYNNQQTPKNYGIALKDVQRRFFEMYGEHYMHVSMRDYTYSRFKRAVKELDRNDPNSKVPGRGNDRRITSMLIPAYSGIVHMTHSDITLPGFIGSVHYRSEGYVPPMELKFFKLIRENTTRGVVYTLELLAA